MLETISATATAADFQTGDLKKRNFVARSPCSVNERIRQPFSVSALARGT
jgi:hypothetical protein